MNEDREARLKEIEDSIAWHTVDGDWIIAQLKASWEREKILKDALHLNAGFLNRAVLSKYRDLYTHTEVLEIEKSQRALYEIAKVYR